MSPAQIEELVKEYSDYGYEHLVRKAIIQAINMTKDEDSQIVLNRGTGVLGYRAVDPKHTSDAILQSKIKE